MMEHTSEEVPRVNLYFPAPTFPTNSRVPQSSEMLALSKDENKLNDIDDGLRPDYRPEEISPKLAGSHKFQEVDRKRDSGQCWCNDSRCLFISDGSMIM